MGCQKILFSYRFQNVHLTLVDKKCIQKSFGSKNGIFWDYGKFQFRSASKKVFAQKTEFSGIMANFQFM
jgi:hypothetical protein